MEEPLINDTQIKARSKYYRPAVERLRIVLMFFACICLIGFPTSYGGIVKTVCGFAPIAFFILSGYLVLRESENRRKRIVRAVRRSAVVFGVLAAVYFVINMLYYFSLGANIFTALAGAGKRLWFNFIVLNVWPFEIGTSVWYVQSLLYAYIIIYFLEKLRLLKYDWIIAAVLIVFTVITGELAGVIRWNILGYNFIPGNFFTRALPYILLGGAIHRKIKSLSNIARPIYWLGIVLGIGLCVGEIYLLGYLGVSGYYGHLIGMAVIAFSVCMLAFQDRSPEDGFEMIFNGNRRYANMIYYLCQPVSVGIVLLLSNIDHDIFIAASGWIGIVTFVLCFAVLCAAAFVQRFWSFAFANN